MRVLIVITAFIFMMPLRAQRSDFEAIDFWRADYMATQQQGEGLQGQVGDDRRCHHGHLGEGQEPPEKKAAG